MMMMIDDDDDSSLTYLVGNFHQTLV